jgi:hypothetical protein
MRTIPACIVIALALAAAGCNPTWTKDGKPNDSSMPLPPAANAPTQAGGSQATPATAPAKSN